MAQELQTKTLPDGIEEKMPKSIKVKREVDGEEKEFEVKLEKSYTLKGPYRGYPYYHPEVKEDNLESVIDAFGMEDILFIIKKYFQRMGMAALSFATEGTREEVKDADGIERGVIKSVDYQKLLQALVTGECRGENLAQLRDKRDDKQRELTELVSQLVDPVTNQARTDIALKLSKMSEVISRLNAQIEAKKRKKRRDLEDEAEEDTDESSNN